MTNAQTLVGHFGGRKFSPKGVKTWAALSWKDSVSSCLDVFVFPWGWINLKFHSEVDASLILAGV